MIDRPLDPELTRVLRERAAQAQWVADSDHLTRCCQGWAEQPLIALDTEFIRTDTFYPRAGLIQVADAEAVYLIDPLAIEDMSALKALLEDASVLKVGHALSEDLELFASQYGCVPRPLFDTQVGCAFAGQGLSLGYQRLLETFFDQNLDKGETRSDWLQRPLTEAQKAYAALDVVFLAPIYQRLAAVLGEDRRYAWVLAECEAMGQRARTSEDPQAAYLKFRQAWKMRPEQLAVLQVLAAWREREARRANKPRNFVLHNTTLNAVAQRRPDTLAGLAQMERMRRSTLSRHGRTLLQLVQEASRQPTPEPPPRPLGGPQQKLLRRLRREVEAVAQEWQIAPELLARKKDLEALVRVEGKSLPEGLGGWRSELLGERLPALCRSFLKGRELEGRELEGRGIQDPMDTGDSMAGEKTSMEEKVPANKKASAEGKTP